VRSSSSTTTTVEDDVSPLAAAYEAASQAYVKASAIPDPDLPALAETTMDPLLGQSRSSVRSLQLQHQVVRPPKPSIARVEVDRSSITVDGDVARLEACVVDDAQVVDVETGKVINGRVSTVLWEAALRKMSDGWRLAEQRVIQRWEGEAGCAVG
jgi:hypothetical protein